MVVEAKRASLTLHYRRHPDLSGHIEQVARQVADESGLSVRPAKMSVELHPPVDHDKGTVLEGLAADATGPVVFLGDDVGDLPAFDALDRLAARGRTTLRVAVAGAETAPDVLARADLVVAGPADAVALLQDLAAAAEA
jgi:trehalose 6-phosphate phosphatase